MSPPEFTETIYRGDKVFWEQYVKGRPEWPDSFFDRVFAYHAANQGSFDRAHDAGGGPGIHSPRLAKRFDHVLVSDPSEDNITTAKARLGEEGEQYSFRVAKLEDAGGLAPASVDLVFVSCAMHYTDTDKAFDAIAHQLKPGGTIAIMCTGVPFLRGQAEQAAWSDLFNEACEGMLVDVRSKGLGDGIKNTITITSSGYNSISVPHKYFRSGVERVKINYPGDLTWWKLHIPAALRDEYPFVSRVGPDEHKIEETDKNWDFQADIAKLVDNYGTFPFPSLESEKMKPLWRKVQEVVGDRKVDATWPVNLILATKNA